MTTKRTKPTARELEKVGKVQLAARYGVTVDQIAAWKREARERSGLEPALRRLKRTEQLQEVLGDMKTRGLTVEALAPDFPDRDLLEKLLEEDPGPSRDERDRAAVFHPSAKLEIPGYMNARLGGGPGSPDLDPPRYTAMKPAAPDWRDLEPLGYADPENYVPLLWAVFLAVILIGLIATGVWG